MWAKRLLWALVLLAGVPLAAGVGLYLAANLITLRERLEIPLPAQIGGHVPVDLELSARLQPTEMAFAADARLALDAVELGELLPTRSYSILAGEVDSPSIASLLGRLEFRRGPVRLTATDDRVAIEADVAGEFYIRPRQDYQRDEEQPGSGVQLPFEGTVAAVFTAVSFSPDWILNLDSRSVEVRLSDDTRAAWFNEFGRGDYLANLVEELVTDRAGILFERLAADSSALKPRIEGFLTREVQPRIPPALGRLRITGVAVDNCPTVTRAQEIVFNITGEADFRSTATEGLQLPALTIRPGPCG